MILISMKNIGSIIIFFSLFVSSAMAQGIQTKWFKSSGESCYIVCDKTGGKPFASGSTGNNPFYICSANPGSYGSRAGFNQAPGNSNVCYVAYGQNKAIRASQYSCLCYK